MLLADDDARVFKRELWTFSELVDELTADPSPRCSPDPAHPTKADKSSLSLWSPGDFRGGYRNKANVESVSCFVADVDGTATRDEVRRKLAGFRALLTTTASSVGHFRVVIDTDRRVLPHEYATFWPAMAAALGCAVDEQCKDARVRRPRYRKRHDDLPRGKLQHLRRHVGALLCERHLHRERHAVRRVERDVHALQRHRAAGLAMDHEPGGVPLWPRTPITRTASAWEGAISLSLPTHSRHF